MFFHEDLKGNRLPRGTVCLTYDDGPGEADGDGPGPHTQALGRFLREEGIRATFFVVGCHVESFRESVASLHACGHLVGNHTYSHPGLVALAESGGDVVAELEQTERLLRPITGASLTYFRAPYGNWRQVEEVRPGISRDRGDSIVADRLNAAGRLSSLIGPVNWDIVAEDWECWRQGIPPDEAARRYADEVERIGRGLILMHDSSEDPAMRARNQTYLMTRHLVPDLKRRGFRFIRLDEVPQVVSAAGVRSLIVLAADGAPSLVVDTGAGDAIIPGTDDAPAQRFGVVPLDGDTFALRAASGLFLTVGARDGSSVDLPVAADGTAVGPHQRLKLEPLGRGGFAIRTHGDRYLSQVDTTAGRRLAATARSAGRSSFTLAPG